MVYFETSVAYDNAEGRTTNERYVFNALTFSEAENKALEEIRAFAHGEINIQEIKKVSYNEIITTDDTVADGWFRSRVSFIMLDEKSGKEKKSFITVLVKAVNVEDAVRRVNDFFSTGMIDYTISNVSETKITDVYTK